MTILKTHVWVAVAFSLVAVASFSSPALAIKGDNKRFAQCKQLKSTNSVNWYGIASGTIDDAFALFENSRSFHTRACFATHKACKTWKKRIWWEIPTMDELRTVYCKRT